jgi:hypothetical protein
MMTYTQEGNKTLKNKHELATFFLPLSHLCQNLMDTLWIAWDRGTLEAEPVTTPWRANEEGMSTARVESTLVVGVEGAPRIRVDSALGAGEVGVPISGEEGIPMVSMAVEEPEPVVAPPVAVLVDEVIA